MAPQPLSPAEQAFYPTLFAPLSDSSGHISGQQAYAFLTLSSIPPSTLGEIWAVADPEDTGRLDVGGWTMAMRLIASVQAGGGVTTEAGEKAPNQLPRFKGHPAPPIPKASFSAGSPIAAAPSSPSRSAFANTSSFAPPAPQQQQQAWDVTPSEKQAADRFFDQLDKFGRGVIEGDVAVPFMLESKLPEVVLASVWDLADIRKEGNLTRDEFAVAMHLIKRSIAGRDLPAELPRSLVPPSLRPASTQAQTQVTAPPRQTSLFDAFGDSPPATPAAAATTYFATAPNAAAGAGTSGFGMAPFAPAPATADSNLMGDADDDDPFVPASSRGGVLAPLRPQPTSSSAFVVSTPVLSPQPTGSSLRMPLSPQQTGGLQPQQQQQQQQQQRGIASTLSPQPTGSSFRAPPPPAPPSASRSPAPPPAVAAGVVSPELASLRAEHGSLAHSVAELQAANVRLEPGTIDSSKELLDLQAKLISLRSTHASEQGQVAKLEALVKEQAEEKSRIRSELITAESELSALKAEKDELDGTVMRDREDIRAMKRRLGELASETSQARELVDKVKKEARQQRGLATIAKKQLATAESAREALRTEAAEAERELKEAEREAEEAKEAVERTEHEHAESKARAATAAATSRSAAPATTTSPTSPSSALAAIPAAIASIVPAAIVPAALTASDDDAVGPAADRGQTLDDRAVTPTAAAATSPIDSDSVLFPPSSTSAVQTPPHADPTAVDDSSASLDTSKDAEDDEELPSTLAGFATAAAAAVVAAGGAVAAGASEIFSGSTGDEQVAERSGDSPAAVIDAVSSDQAISVAPELDSRTAVVDEVAEPSAAVAPAADDLDSSDDEVEGPEDLDGGRRAFLHRSGGGGDDDDDVVAAGGESLSREASSHLASTASAFGSFDSTGAPAPPAPVAAAAASGGAAAAVASSAADNLAESDPFASDEIEGVVPAFQAAGVPLPLSPAGSEPPPPHAIASAFPSVDPTLSRESPAAAAFDDSFGEAAAVRGAAPTATDDDTTNAFGTFDSDFVPVALGSGPAGSGAGLNNPFFSGPPAAAAIAEEDQEENGTTTSVPGEAVESAPAVTMAASPFDDGPTSTASAVAPATAGHAPVSVLPPAPPALPRAATSSAASPAPPPIPARRDPPSNPPTPAASSSSKPPPQQQQQQQPSLMKPQQHAGFDDSFGNDDDFDTFDTDFEPVPVVMARSSAAIGSSPPTTTTTNNPFAATHAGGGGLPGAEAPVYDFDPSFADFDTAFDDARVVPPPPSSAPSQQQPLPSGVQLAPPIPIGNDAFSVEEAFGSSPFAPLASSGTGGGSFTSSPPETTTTTTGQHQQQPLHAFDDAFADAPPSQPSSTQQYAAPAGPPPGRQPTSAPSPAPSQQQAGRPNLPSRPPTTTTTTTDQQQASGAAEPDDIPDVKKIVAMGFSRSQALNALEIGDYNLQKAIDHLVSGA